MIHLTKRINQKKSLQFQIKVNKKKSKFKDERDRPSPVAKKITKKKKDKRETKEISTVFEVNAHVRERCTKTKGQEKEKYSAKHSKSFFNYPSFQTAKF